MKSLVCCLALAIAAASQPAMAEPRHMSQNPRVGLLAEIRFQAGSARLPDASGSQLGRIAAWAFDNYDGLIVLDGHADRFGPARGNVRLSLRRAQQVRDQLLALGVDPNQIIVTAFGSEGRRHARVAIWGTRNSYEEVIGMRRKAKRILVPSALMHETPTVVGRR